MKVNYSKFNNSWYKAGSSFPVRIIWYFTNALFFINSANPSSRIKVWLLKLFGAKIGAGVLIKPGVNVKYPWRLKIGDNSWIGENVWIDNLEDVEIGANVCLSQGAMILTGNHNYKSECFDLIVQKVVLEDGVWIGAQAVVCPGVLCKSHAILTVNSVANSTLEPYKIYQGNPAKFVRERKISGKEVVNN